MRRSVYSEQSELCVIVDASVAALVFAESPDPDFLPVFEWLHNGKGHLVFGGRLADELLRMNAPWGYVLQLWRRGRASRVDDQEAVAEEKLVRGTGLCESDDPHVIALARLSGARTLCSRDKKLHEDFKKKQLIDKPRGVVYQAAGHRNLLRHTSSCGRL